MPIENFKSFVLDSDANMAKTAKRGKVEATYKVIGVSGCDFIVEKTTKTTTNTLVCLISQKQVFFKNKKDEVTQFSPNSYVGFMNASEEDVQLIDEKGEQCTWIHSLVKGKAMGDFIEAVIKEANKDTIIYDFIKKGYVTFDGESIDNFGGFINKPESILDIQKHASMIYKCMPNELREHCRVFFGKQLIRDKCYRYRYYEENVPFEVKKSRSVINALFDAIYAKGTNIFKLIDNAYGSSGVVSFIEKFFETPVSSTPSSNHFDELLHCENFKFSSFLDYMFDSAVQQGYAASMDNFVTLWKDTIKMQKDILNKVDDKYPEHLATLHQILSYKYSILKDKIDEEKFNRRVEEMKQFEMTSDKEYIIIAPKTKENMIEEARQQSNCLASYVSKVINGTCYIFFMRKKSNPDKSLVTIEVLKDGKLSQVQARYNYSPSYEERKFVEEWHAKKFADFQGIPE